MDWKKLALCGALAGASVGCGGPDTPTMDPETRWYVVSDLQIPEGEGGSAVGFNLDGEVSTGDGTSCVDLTPDFNSLRDPGEVGVDNAFSTLVPTLGGQLADQCDEGTPAAECLSQLLQKQIAAGSLLLMMEVSDIESYANDEEVTVQLHLGTVPTCSPMVDPCPPMLAGATIAPGQVFETTAIGAAVDGSILSGRLRAQTDLLEIPINTADLSITLQLRNAEIRGNITETSMSNGAIGGSLRIADIVTAAEAIMPGIGGTVMGILENIADMEPSGDDETMCAALSAGIAFEAVDVDGVGEPVTP